MQKGALEHFFFQRGTLYTNVANVPLWQNIPPKSKEAVNMTEVVKTLT